MATRSRDIHGDVIAA